MRLGQSASASPCGRRCSSGGVEGRIEAQPKIGSVTAAEWRWAVAAGGRPQFKLLGTDANR
jgi:hypothetical protein